MATLVPSIKTIKKSRQPPTPGELFLLQYLQAEFDSESYVYFQPYFNGDRPDIVITNKRRGIIVIEVKDWNLIHYDLNGKNHWFVGRNRTRIKSPFSQVFGYKQNMFDIHVNGLLEKNLRNKNFYKAVSCFVYFHNETKESLKHFYQPHIDHYRKAIKALKLPSQPLPENHIYYNKKQDTLSSRREKFERDLYRHSVTKDQFSKIKYQLDKDTNIYTESIHKAFLRYLQPPFHAKNEGKPIRYSKKQLQLTSSTPGSRLKIKGVAGSGKTSVLAKRAVNAHKRHRDRVLILTFNLTLRSYIHDKISEVREDFSWGAFDIINYHKFMTQSFNSSGIELQTPENIKNNDRLRNEFLDNNYYSNENIFDGRNVPHQYQTILIDEIQDYKPEWIKIIRKYFLATDGEMLLFGDEKQNIYERVIEQDRTTRTIQGFGRWEKLTESFRFRENSPTLSLAKDFQREFFCDRYEPDEEAAHQPALAGIGLNQCVNYSPDAITKLVEYVFDIAKRENIHPNDIVVLSSQILQMREIDFLIRRDKNFNENTLTTFESKEAALSLIFSSSLNKIRSNKKYAFNLNSGVVKISTIHSFKGYESPTVFLIVNDRDSPELVYVGITRAKINLVVFVEPDGRYEAFFKSRLEAPIEDTKPFSGGTGTLSS